MNKRSSDDKNQASLENQNKSTITTEQAIKFVSAEWTDEEIKLLVKGVKGIYLYYFIVLKNSYFIFFPLQSYTKWNSKSVFIFWGFNFHSLIFPRLDGMLSLISLKSIQEENLKELAKKY